MHHGLDLRELLLDRLGQAELHGSSLEVVAGTLGAEVDVPFQMIRQEAQAEFKGIRRMQSGR